MAIDQQFKTDANVLRGALLAESKKVKGLMKHSVFERDVAEQDHGEMKANIMLSYRHLEDARMRLGKAIQAFEGGVSVYDKKPGEPYPA